MKASTLDTIAPGARVAVIRIRSLGDCVLTTPALELLHAFRPDLSIGVAVEERFRGVFEHHPAVAAILPAELGAVRRFRPEMVINFHGGTRSTMMTIGSGARIRAGFGHFVGAQAYNVRIPRAQQILGQERPVHTAEHLASAMFYLGVPHASIPRASLYAADERPVESGNYVVMHPFASAPGKAWPVSRFVEVAEKLGTRVVVLAGPQDDDAPFAGFSVSRNASLDTVKRLMRDAALFIGNDSGPAHMAAAFGIPVVVLFGPSDPVTWGPWRTAAKVLRFGWDRSQTAAEPRPEGAGARHAPAPSGRGSVAVSVDECLKAVEELRVRV